MGASLSYPEVDLAGKVALVTGGNTGIGYETAKGLARMGAHTFIACRSQARAEAAIECMKRELNQLHDGNKQQEKEEPKKELSCDEVEVKGAGENRSSEEPEENKGGEEQVENKGGAEQVENKGGEEGGANKGGEEGGANKGGEEGGANKGGEEGGSSAVAGSRGGAGASEEGVGELKEETGVNEEVRSKDATVKRDGEDSRWKEIKVEFLPLDLSSFQSTIECVRLFKEKSLPLHILVNNAAVAWTPFGLTDDGYEIQIQVNHLGPMLFTLELLPVLVETASSSGDVRICFVSSKANYRASDFNMDTFLVTQEEDYNRLRTYPNTKLYNIMVGAALQRRLEGSAITVSSPEPGTVKTELGRGWADKAVFTFLTKTFQFAAGRTPLQGAATSLNCAVNPKLNSKKHFFYSDCKPVRPNSDACIEENQERLWKRSIEVFKDHLSPAILEKYGPTTIPGPDSQSPPSESKSRPSESEAALLIDSMETPESKPTTIPGPDSQSPTSESKPRPSESEAALLIDSMETPESKE